MRRFLGSALIVSVIFTCLVVIWLELISVGMLFGCFGSLHALVPGLLIYLGRYFELVDEVLEVILVLGGQDSGLEVLI